MRKLLNKYIATFDYSDKTSFVLSVTNDGASIGLFVTVNGAPVGLKSGTLSSVLSISSRERNRIKLFY